MDGKRVGMFFKFVNDLLDSVTPEVSIFTSFILSISSLLTSFEKVLGKKYISLKRSVFVSVRIFIDICIIMETLLITPSQFLPNSAVAENRIREIFFHHWEKMKDEFLAAVNQINTWRQTMINDTNRHADDLLHALASDFNRFKTNCQQQCDENLEKTDVYHGVQNVELFNELYESCRSVKFQLARLESVRSELHTLSLIHI